MAEIRDFNRNQYLLKGGKEKKGKDKDQENDSDKKSLDNMLARHRQIRLYTILVVLALLAAVAAGSYITWKNKIYIGYQVIQQDRKSVV